MAIPSAVEARDRTKAMIAKNVEEVEAKINEKISDAIKRGEYHTIVQLGSVGASTLNTLKNHLRDIGYEVTSTPSSDQRDYGTFTISWLTAAVEPE